MRASLTLVALALIAAAASSPPQISDYFVQTWMVAGLVAAPFACWQPGS